MMTEAVLTRLRKRGLLPQVLPLTPDQIPSRYPNPGGPNTMVRGTYDANKGIIDAIARERQAGGVLDRPFEPMPFVDDDVLTRPVPSVVFNKTQGGFDTIDLDPRQIRRGESPAELIRRIDLGKEIMRQPVESSNYLTDEPMREAAESYRTLASAAPVLEPLRRTPPPLAPVPPLIGSAEDPNAPMVRYNNKARPIGVEGGDPLLRDKALLEAQENYKAPFSTKDLLKRLAIGFVTGGIPGAAGNALDYGLNQNTRNQDAVGNDMVLTRNRIAQAEDATRQGYQDRLLRANVLRAETPETPNIPGDWAQIDTNGDGIPDTEEYIPKTIGARRGVFQKPEKDAAGFTLPPGGARYDAKGKLIVEREPKPEPLDDSGFTNAQIESAIQAAKKERDGIWASIKGIPPTITMPGRYEGDPPSVQPNPAYTDLMQRGRKLDDEIRDLSLKKKPARSLTRGNSAASNKGFSIGAYLARNKGATEADAKAFAAQKYKGVPIVP